MHEFADIPPCWRLSLSVLRRVLFARLKAARLCTDLWLLHTRRREIGTVAGSRWWKDKGSGAHWRVASRRMFSATRVRRQMPRSPRLGSAQLLGRSGVGITASPEPAGIPTSSLRLFFHSDALPLPARQHLWRVMRRIARMYSRKLRIVLEYEQTSRPVLMQRMPDGEHR